MHLKIDPPLNPEHGIAVFTDGSATTSDKHGGWAWVAIDAFDGIHYESGFCRCVTNNQMELHAIGQAIHSLQYYLEEEGGYDPQQYDLLVYSDSEYAVLGLKDKTRKRNKNTDYWKGAEQYIGNWRSVTFEHVKGHNGSKYNELADKMAGEARKNEDHDPEGSSKEAVEES
jgi:ribonuclease HI